MLVSGDTRLLKSEPEAYRNAAEHLTDRMPLCYFGDNPVKDVDHPVSMGGGSTFCSPEETTYIRSVPSITPWAGVHEISTFDEVGVADRW